MKAEISLDPFRSRDPQLVIRIDIPWPRIFRLWGRLGSEIKRVRPDLAKLAKEDREDVEEVAQE